MESVDLQDRFHRGRIAFSDLIRSWMDLSGWSHPKIIQLGKASMTGIGWLHSSQINGLRTGKLINPGPRVFVAIERLNRSLYDYGATKALIPGTSSSALYAKAYAITVDDQPPELGWWIEAFCGEHLPMPAQLVSVAEIRQLFAE